MHLDGLDLNLLVSLDALLSERNVTRAAERLHVTQPAVSAALQKLRVHLSDPLLERVGRQLELTPRARAIAGPVKELLLEIRALLITEATFDSRTAKRTFRIVMSSYCAEVFGVPLIHAINRLAPCVSCQIDELTIDALSRVEDGQIDICVALPESAIFNAYSNSELSDQFLFSDHFVLVGARGNPVFSQEIDYETFCKQPYIDVRFSGTVISNVEQALRRQGAWPQIRAWAPSFVHALAMTSGTNLLTIVPSRMLARHGDHLGLKAVPSPLRLSALDETAMWHPRTDLDPGHRWLREVMVATAAELPETKGVLA